MENNKALKTQGIAMIIFLAIQYVLGMTVNLFSNFPKTISAGKLWEYAWSQFYIAGHIVIGILLLIGAIVFVIRSVIAKDVKWIIFSVVGLLAIIIAGSSGAIFITAQTDIYSYVMSLGFIVAVASYFIGIIYSK